jgi:catechol 2,3-dioxygenase-like lactoylglutathione lyase family enzyme
MPLNKMEHYLVLTDDIDATRDFYRDVIGLAPGFRPELGFPGHWVYLGDIPVIHIADWDSYRSHSERLGIPVSERGEGTGPFDHIAFNGTEPDAMMAKLEALEIPFRSNEIPAAGLVQLFLDDPNGIKIELNYRI